MENRNEEIKKFRLFPDGSAGMVFTLSGALLHAESPSAVYPGRFIYGQLSGYLDLYVLPGTQLLIVPFQPAALSGWLNIPAVELIDRVVELHFLLDKKQRAAVEAVSANNNINQNIRILETLIAGKASAKDAGKVEIVHNALQIIKANKGIIGIQELSSVTTCHQRTLERLFRHYVGLSPKKVCSLSRIHHFIKETKVARSSAPLTSGALDSGYYDQAHLNHEFKTLTGVTPTTYFRNGEHLAVNFFCI